MKTNFEEKVYENYFNVELAHRSKIFYPPGQVQEGVLGFDSIAFSSNRKLWRLLGFPFLFSPPFKGAELRDIADELERELGVFIDGLPSMKVNVLFQYKKPEYIKTSNGTEWTHWNQPYFRYDIYKKQQNLLMHIQNGFSTKILILYASPAIYDVNELVTAYKKKEIIKYSNFKKVVELNGHDRNTYIKSGLYSIACSEPVRINNFNLIELLNSSNDLPTNEDNKAFIINFRKRLIPLVNNGQYFSSGFNDLMDLWSEYEKYPLLYTFLIMKNFNQLTNLQWVIV